MTPTRRSSPCSGHVLSAAALSPVGACSRAAIFPTDDGRARMVALAVTPKEEQGKPSFTLNTGRVRDQWHTMTRTGRVAELMAHSPEPHLVAASWRCGPPRHHEGRSHPPRNKGRERRLARGGRCGIAPGRRLSSDALDRPIYIGGTDRPARACAHGPDFRSARPETHAGAPCALGRMLERAALAAKRRAARPRQPRVLVQGAEHGRLCLSAIRLVRACRYRSFGAGLAKPAAHPDRRPSSSPIRIRSAPSSATPGWSPAASRPASSLHRPGRLFRKAMVP